MSLRRVVVTGMGVITSLGETVEAFWSSLISGESGVRRVSLFDASAYDVRIGGECTGFDPARYMDRKSAKRLDRFAQFAMAAAVEAERMSGADLRDYRGDPRRLGVVLGTGIGGLMELEQQHRRLIDKGPGKVSAFTIPKLMVNAAAGNLAIEYKIEGLSTTVGTACASAAHAMSDAFNAIRRGECDLVMTGGAEAALTPLGLGAFSAMKALSTRNDDPEHASRPFDRERDGFVLGEGGGVLIFEELEHAKKRGANILAEILGYGASTDATHITQPAENGNGAAAAIRQCLEMAGVGTDDVQYINAHGTSTALGDLAETLAIKATFGSGAQKLAVSSTKSSTGHLLGASGGVELVATIMAINHSTAPATYNLDNPSDGCDLDYVANTPRDIRIDRAISNSFGFGGHNACVMVGRYS